MDMTYTTIPNPRKVKKAEFLDQLQWCRECFGPGAEVHSMTQAGLHRWSYEFVAHGIQMLHFSDESDYMLYILKWT
jgi:hypothetical protein